MCMCVHVCVYVCEGCLIQPHPNPTTHPPPGGPPNQLKFYKSRTNQDISILFEDLTPVETPTPTGGCIVWWVGV